MIRVLIDGVEIPPYPPADGAAPAERYYVLQGTQISLVNAAGATVPFRQGEKLELGAPYDPVAAAKQRELNRFAGRSRIDPAGDRARLERRRKAAKAAKQARKQARRRA